MSETSEVAREEVLDALLALLPVMPMARPADPYGRTVAEMATEHMLTLRQERDQLADALRAIDSAHALAARDAENLRRELDEARLVLFARGGVDENTRGLVWTAARRDMLSERFPTSRDDEALLQELNNLPGLLSINSVRALRSQASKMRLTRNADAVSAMRAAGATDANKRRLLCGGGRPWTWTPERDELLRKEFVSAIDINVLRLRLNELPGFPIASAKAVRERAKKLKLRLPIEVTLQRKRLGSIRGNMASRAMVKRPPAKPTAPVNASSKPAPLPVRAQPVVAPEPAPEPLPVVLTPEESAHVADTALAAKHQRVRDSIKSALKRGKGSISFEASSMIATKHNLPLREVMRLVGEVRSEMRS